MKAARVSVAVVTLGCPKNLVDSEVIAGLVGKAGFILTGDLDSAEAIVINTCAFIGPAREEAWSRIEEAVELRRRGPCRALIVAGCLAQGFGEEIARRAPEVDRLLGTGDVDRVVAALRSVLAEDDQIGAVAGGGSGSCGKVVGPAFAYPGYLPDASVPRLVSTPPHYAYLKIAEGCSHRCAFCLIPSLRGRYRSRPPEDVVREARALDRMGVKELVLVAQDTTIYGRDLAGRSLLADLARRVLDETNLAWLRVLYGYPGTLSDDFVALLAAEADRAGGTLPAGQGRLCRYLDLPMQHASGRVLRTMRRPETGDSLLRLVERLRREVPGLTLRSSFIVGLPGENEKDFQELLDFLAAVRIEHAGFFPYSREEGTQAAEMPGQVPEPVKKERLARAATLQRRLSLRYRRGLVGVRLKVMVDQACGTVEQAREAIDSARVARVVGRTEGDAPEIDGSVLVDWPGDRPRPAPGDLVAVEITRARPYDLLARPDE